MQSQGKRICIMLNDSVSLTVDEHSCRTKRDIRRSRDSLTVQPESAHLKFAQELSDAQFRPQACSRGTHVLTQTCARCFIGKAFRLWKLAGYKRLKTYACCFTRKAIRLYMPVPSPALLLSPVALKCKTRPYQKRSGSSRTSPAKTVHSLLKLVSAFLVFDHFRLKWSQSKAIVDHGKAVTAGSLLCQEQV
eukprot:350184-Pelagomonas_calceolata.AAC.2